jgi:hypothetical protein
MLCNGNHSEYCGGANRLDVYDYNNSVNLPPWTTTSGSTPPGTTVAPPPADTAAPTTSSPAPAGTLGVKPNVGGYAFQGCYTEATTQRALSQASFFDYTAMTLEECATSCAAYNYFGVEYGGECWSNIQFRTLILFTDL